MSDTDMRQDEHTDVTEDTRIEFDKAAWLAETEEFGLRPCRNHIRGCRTRLDSNYKKVKCDQCLEKDRERDRARRKKAKEEGVAQEDGKRKCTTCCQIYDETMFQGERGITKTCKKCRDSNKLQDSKRDQDRRRELARAASKKSENIATKKAWVDNNREKRNIIDMNYRARQNAENREAYLKRNAETMAKWREKNPERSAELLENQKNTTNRKRFIYTRSAREKGLAFELDDDEFEQLLSGGCHYCDNRMNIGIDRIDSERHYTSDNCVSCCKICNYMKSNLPVSHFIGIAHHILAFQGIINGPLYPQLFRDFQGASYRDYERRARKKELSFEISLDEWSDLIAQSCTICGKDPSDTHTNGIDRIDNSIGYEESNIQICCGTCNYLKRDLAMGDFVNQLLCIFTKYPDPQEEKDITIGVHLKRNPHKPDQESIQKIRNDIKEKREEQIRENYKPENILERAQQNAEKRRMTR